MKKYLEVEKRLSQRAFDEFKSMLDSGYLDDMIIYDLVQAAKFAVANDEKDLLEALEIVLEYYTNEDILEGLE